MKHSFSYIKKICLAEDAEVVVVAVASAVAEEVEVDLVRVATDLISATQTPLKVLFAHQLRTRRDARSR